MVNLVNITTNWLLISALYTLVALGFTLIFGVGGVLNLAHGASITLGAFSAYYANELGLGIWTGLLAAILVPALFNAVLYQGMVRFIQDRPIIVMLVTFLWALIIEELFLNLAGSQPKALPSFLPGATVILGNGIENNRILAFTLSWLILVAIFIFVTRTQTGKGIIATSMSEKGADLVGIERTKVNLYTWVLAAALAGIAGVFLGSFQTLDYRMGINPLLLSFSIVVLGGLGSIKGTVIAAYLIGLFEVVTVSVIDARLSGLAPLLLLVIVILFRPQGLFGRAMAGDV